MHTKLNTIQGLKSLSFIKSHFTMGLLCIGITSCAQIPAFGQESLTGDLRMNGKQVEAAFEAQRMVLQKSSAVIYKDRRPIGYGVIMSSTGHILVKHSELFELNENKKNTLKADLMIIVDTDRYSGMDLIASDTEWDLAIIKIDANNLTPVEWSDQTDIQQGTWVVTNGSSWKKGRRVNIGIISANAREIKGAPPVMIGLGLKDLKDNKGVEITRVADNSGAKEAGVLKDDIIKSFDGQDVLKREDIIDIIRQKQPGDFVDVEILRKDKEETLSMELRPRTEIDGDGKTPLNRNDSMSGDFSARRDSFPMALQHDIDQNSRQTGGPLLNLQGKAVGINIARANRAESFAIPAKEALEVYQAMLKTVAE